MPIRGLTDNVKAKFPDIGVLRKGAPKTEGRIGRDLDYFRFTSDDPAIVKTFTDRFGEKPRTLRVYLPYPRAADNWETWKEAWTASGLSHRCDGETCIVWKRKDGSYSQEPQPCPGGCSDIGRLTVIIPELFEDGHVGFVTLQTHGNHDLRNITAALEQAEMMRANNPQGLTGVEWTLYRREASVSMPTKDGRVRGKKWLVYLVPSTDWARLQIEMSRAAQMMEPQPAPLMLPESSAAKLAGNVDPLTGEILIDDDEGEIIEDLPFTEEAEIPPKPQGPPLQAVKNGKVLNEAEALQVKILNVINARGLKGETVRKIVGMVTNKEQAVDEVTSVKHLTAILKEFESD